MAIRDGISINLDEAKVEPVVRKGKVKYVKSTPSSPRGRYIAGVALVIVFILVLFFVFTHLNPPVEGERLDLVTDKSSYSTGETVTVTGILFNKGSSSRIYGMPLSNAFLVSITNESGGEVASTPTSNISLPAFREIVVGPSATSQIGSFSWNQTVRVSQGGNDTYVQVPPGTYIIHAYLNLRGLPLSAEKRLLIT